MSEPVLDEQVDAAAEFLANSAEEERQIVPEVEVILKKKQTCRVSCFVRKFVLKVSVSAPVVAQPEADKISQWKKEQSERIAKKGKFIFPEMILCFSSLFAIEFIISAQTKKRN